jgi:hypothetical protein
MTLRTTSSHMCRVHYIVNSVSMPSVVAPILIITIRAATAPCADGPKTSCGWLATHTAAKRGASTVRYEAASLIVLMVFTSQWKICGISA